MDKDKIVAILIVILIFGLGALYSYHYVQNAKEDLRICKELGYDGVKFVNKYTNELECSNFTELERAKRSADLKDFAKSEGKK